MPSESYSQLGNPIGKPKNETLHFILILAGLLWFTFSLFVTYKLGRADEVRFVNAHYDCRVKTK
jgi:hypothetical protein